MLGITVVRALAFLDPSASQEGVQFALAAQSLLMFGASAYAIDYATQSTWLLPVEKPQPVDSILDKMEAELTEKESQTQQN